MTDDPGVLVTLPYVDGYLREETTEAIRKAGVSPHTVNLSDDPVFGYAKLLRLVWDCRWDWVNVEHDIVFTPAQFSTFQTCRQDWCYFAYDVDSDYDGPMLGFTRFRVALRQRWPHAATNAAKGPGLHNGLAAWKSVDQNLWTHLNRLGEVAHRHYPNVQHLHNYREDR